MKTLQAKHTTALILETIEGVQQIETNPSMWEIFHLDNDRSVTVALIEISTSPFVPNIVSLLETLLPLIASPELFYHISEMEGGVDITLSDIELDDDDILEIESIRLMDDDEDFIFRERDEDEEQDEEQEDILLPDDDEPSFENLPAENPAVATGGELEFDIEDEPAPVEVLQVQETPVVETPVAEIIIENEIPAELEFETEAPAPVEAQAEAEAQADEPDAAPVPAPVEVQAEAPAQQTDHRMVELLEALQKEGADAILIDNTVTLSDKNNALMQITLGEKQILNKSLPSFTLSSESDSDRSFLAIDALVRHVKNFHL